ncbi:MAG: Flp pilus assembly complex ATPase component TadA [Chitinivibrionales bacterium]|nr:Flp pilus assembly complex ATPase component TadA [Chitinivibrionales bacterium]
MIERRRKKLGEILLAQGLIDEKQLLHALHEHKRTGDSLGMILISLGYVKQETLNSVLGEQIQLTQRKRIGEVLIEQGLINQQQLQAGLAEQQKTKLQLGKCLVNLNFISEKKLIDVLSAQLDIQHVVLESFTFSRSLLAEIPEDVARKYKVIPLFERHNILTVAMADPTNLRTLDHLKFKTGKDIEPVIASERSIITAIDHNYMSGLQEMNDMLKEAKETDELDVVKHKEGAEDQESLTDEEGIQVVKIVNLIIIQAVSDGASDIHIEPMERHYRIRFRVDGELVEKNPIPLQFSNQIISRLKILGGMDIAERRKPQDGHFQVRHQGRQIDLRVSTYPAMSRSRGVSEKVVMRIIDQEGKMLTLDQLGFLPHTLKMFDDLIRMPDGILLVTGPTGSGKTSTLYASLQRVNIFYANRKNIITMEDPIEACIEGLNQGQINVKAGFSFASGLRSILRQDPDIIMVGEMRDTETCQMAIQAALTGHLVFSTLHTNDSPSTFTRLFDMGVEPYLIASTVRGILAQRLVRKICSNCREEYLPEPASLQRLGLVASTKFYRGKGCRLCHNTGYKGRLGIFELLVLDQQVERLVVKRASAEEIKQYCMQRGDFDTLRRDGLRKVLQGLTTIEQILGVTQDD